MHILIIPSEGFVPEHNKLEGIFQYHQALILKEAGYRVGALSVRLRFSAPMFLKGLLYKLAGQKANNATDEFTLPALVKFATQKILFPKKYITAESLDGIRVYRMDALYRRRPTNNKNHVSWTKAGLLCFDEYLAHEGRPDLIHAHDAIYAGMLAERIHAKHGIAYLITEHSSSYALGATDAGILQRVQKAHTGAAGLFAVSTGFAKLLNEQFGFRRFQYLPNVLDPQLEAAPYDGQRPANTRFRFLHIAVFKPVKDQRTLLTAFASVAQHTPDADLYIAGDGELHDELHQQAVDLGLQQRVHFLGRLNRHEVMAELKACDCFVLSSKYETFGLATVEAMLFGKPVVVTRCGVAPDIVDEKVGLLVEAGDAEGLAQAMLKMLKNSKSFDPDYIRRLTLAQFGKKRFLENITKRYKEAV